jgi:hypothetical protein
MVVAQVVLSQAEPSKPPLHAQLPVRGLQEPMLEQGTSSRLRLLCSRGLLNQLSPKGQNAMHYAYKGEMGDREGG